MVFIVPHSRRYRSLPIAHRGGISSNNNQRQEQYYSETQDGPTVLGTPTQHHLDATCCPSFWRNSSGVNPSNFYGESCVLYRGSL